MARVKDFLKELYEEKRLHKEHRHKQVVMKFILTGSLYGISQLFRTFNVIWLSNFLFIIPFIAYIIDIYICAEHYKVQRIGRFVNKLAKDKNPNICDEEIQWEEYMTSNREGSAIIASLAYSLIITVFSIISLWHLKNGDLDLGLFYSWVFLCAVGYFLVILRSYSIKIQLKKM